MIEFCFARARMMGTFIGAVFGLLVGLWLIPNFGIASRGWGMGVWGWLLGTSFGAYVGFRLGEMVYRRRKFTPID